jgi:SAM-dependent methyltransferase
MYAFFDAISRPFELQAIQQNRFLKMIPAAPKRKGGNHSWSEWGYNIGQCQTLVSIITGAPESLDVLDVGCGTGRLALAMGPLLGRSGTYVGVDVNLRDIEFCRRYYKVPQFKFDHLLHSNRSYAPDQPDKFTPYTYSDASFDVVTALSVWTHLNEADGIFYAKEVARVLRPGGKAMITFFYLDDDYEAFRDATPEISSISLRRPRNYICDQPIDGSLDWLRPSWTHQPESIVGVTPAGIARLQEASGLRLERVMRGFWKEKPGMFFQDALIFTKP